MKKLLLGMMIIITSSIFALPTPDFLSYQMKITPYVLKRISPHIHNIFEISSQTVSIADVRTLLNRYSAELKPAVINKALDSLQCTRAKNISIRNMLTIIDYSLPSNQKRLWVFDLQNRKLLYHTYVSHGLTSGALFTEYFSNKWNSKASSIGVFKTEKAYYGREGLSLRLDGLDVGFNNNAQRRYIVMHGGWYMDESFIKKYGRPGRSWGCPAMPKEFSSSIINTIKENSLLVIYYPSEPWLAQSRFLNCKRFAMVKNTVNNDKELTHLLPDVQRDPILFLDLNNNGVLTESKPILVMHADQYSKVFQMQPPLTRMLRRQIEKADYIALTQPEFDKIISLRSQNPQEETLGSIAFIVPVLKMKGGYYETEMHKVPLGKIKNARLENENVENLAANKRYLLDFENKSSVHLKTTSQFIRWLGL